MFDQFRDGLGQMKVLSGEYELYNPLNGNQVLPEDMLEGVTPGLSITMAIIFGQYGVRTLDRCPRAGCSSRDVLPTKAGYKTWYVLPSIWYPHGLCSC